MPRILFVKTSSLGDVVHNCPAVSDVAHLVPEASIDWVIEEAFAEVAAMHASVRRVIPIAIRRWRGALLDAATWPQMSGFFRALRTEHYDCVIDSQGLVKSALVANLARGPAHGFDGGSARERLAAEFYDFRHAVGPAEHAVGRNRRLAAAALGYALPDTCDYGLRAAGAPPIEVREPFALLLTMSSRADKLWPEVCWIALGRRLAGAGIGCILPWGSSEEQASCGRIAANIDAALVPGRMSLAEIARLMRRARCVAGVDTGLAHLAEALGVPAVGIYAGSDPSLTGLFGSSLAANVGAPGAPPSADDVFAALAALWARA